MDINEVKDFIENDEEGKKLISSLTDKRVSEGIETFKKNHFNDKLNEMQQTIEQLQAEKKYSSLRDIALSAGVPDSLLDYVIGDNEETTLQRSEDFLSKINGSVEEGTQQKLTEMLKGKAPHKQTEEAAPLDMDSMSSDEIIQNAARFK